MPVLPAHAGMIPAICPTPSYTTGAPRTCGDDPFALSTNTNEYLCSPHMRG